VHLLRLLFFAVLSATWLMAEGPSALVSWTALALLAFALFKARRELVATVWAARRLDRPADARRGERRETDAQIGHAGASL
jgi:hypothetical protein